MKLQHLQPLAALAALAYAFDHADDFVVRRRGTEFNISPRHDHTARDGGSHSGGDLETRQEALCGGEEGSCPAGQCCSESGHCGTSPEYCIGPQCQIQYSNGECDAR